MKNVEEQEIPDIKRRKPILHITCSGCVFHKRLAVYPRPCIALGSSPSSDTCARFVPDPAHLGDPATVTAVLQLLASAKHPEVLSAAMLSAKKVARAGLTLGQVVYFRVMGDDYLANYARGTVTGVTRDSAVLTGAQAYTALIGFPRILDRSEWEKKREGLVKRARINDPEGGLRKLDVRGKERLVLYEPEQIGFAVKKRKKRRKEGPITLNPIN